MEKELKNTDWWFDMRFNTYINNKKCLEWGLNPNQGALFDLLNQASSWAEEIIINDVVYYWVSRNKVIEELPLYYKTADTVYRHFSDLHDKGLIIYLKQGKHGDKDLIRLTGKGKSWNEFNELELFINSEMNPSKCHQLGNESEITRKQIRDNSEIDPTNNNTTNNNINDHINNTRTQKINVKELLAEYGVTGQLADEFIAHRKFRKAPITKRVMALIANNARIAGIETSFAIEIILAKGTWVTFDATWNWQSTASSLRNEKGKTGKFDAHNGLRDRDLGETEIPSWALDGESEV